MTPQRFRLHNVGSMLGTFGLSHLRSDPNCILIQDPGQVWGVQDFLPRRNLLLATDTLATQNVAVVATAYKLYMQGTGSITLSGTATGTLNGTGANDRVSLSFTPTAGTLTLTVSGTVTFGMLCRADTIDQSYQKITDWTTEQYAWAAQKQVPWLRRNRFLNTATLSTQTVSSVTASPITVSFKGTGTITFSTAYSGSLVGTGANDRVSATFTPSAGNLVCTVSGTVTEAQCENASAATEYQPIGASWGDTYTASAIAAGYPISLWQDSAGTIAVNGDNQAIGVCLDQKQLGVDTGLTTSKMTGTNWSVVGGVATHTTGSGGSLTKLGACEIGSIYWITCFLSGRSAGSVSLRAGSSTTTAVSVNGWASVITTCVTDTYARITPSSDFDGAVSNVRYVKLSGYTAIQATSANQPKWRLDANGKPYIERDLTNDSLPITLPNLGSNCSIYVGEGSTVTESTGQTLNGSYEPITPAKDYGRVIFQSPTSNAAKVIKWLKARAGY